MLGIHFRVIVAAFALCLCVIAARAEPYRIVALGDSLTAGYQLPPGQSFADKLQAALRAAGHDVTIANAGVSGDTTSGGLARLTWSVPDGTQLVLLELGANDMLRGLDPAIPRANLDRMMTQLAARKIGMVLLGMRAAPNLGADYRQAFDSIYPDLAKKFGVPLYPFFLDGVAGNPGLQLEDGLHPTAAGVDRMVAGVLPVVEPLLPKQD